jgi:hypothetical protein
MQTKSDCKATIDLKKKRKEKLDNERNLKVDLQRIYDRTLEVERGLVQDSQTKIHTFEERLGHRYKYYQSRKTEYKSMYKLIEQQTKLKMTQITVAQKDTHFFEYQFTQMVPLVQSWMVAMAEWQRWGVLMFLADALPAVLYLEENWICLGGYSNCTIATE